MSKISPKHCFTPWNRFKNIFWTFFCCPGYSSSGILCTWIRFRRLEYYKKNEIIPSDVKTRALQSTVVTDLLLYIILLCIIILCSNTPTTVYTLRRSHKLLSLFKVLRFVTRKWNCSSGTYNNTSSSLVMCREY